MFLSPILGKIKKKLKAGGEENHLSQYQKDLLFSRNSNVKVFNFWAELKKIEDLWFYQFINRYQEGLYTSERPITFFSVYGDREVMEVNRERPRVFYTAENVDQYRGYDDHCLKDVDLSIGFEYLDASNYLRFPLWITWFFKPLLDFENVIRQVNDISHFNYDFDRNRRFCTLIASHDQNGIRSEISKVVGQVGRVDFAGRFCNNTRELHKVYNNSKHYFLTLYKFNVCPENSNKDGYVTEKIFEAINSGCIPIYWGSEGRPEPEVLNPDAILFYDRSDPRRLLRQVDELNSNEKLYREFVLQDRFLPCAVEYIWNRLEELYRRLKEIEKNL
ncbi:glycosyltransferase family 10 domain-containing protein [Arcticibacter sp. MXS-1]|uniref:glycosyltransferase family 10 domain-containing protein n=1 Tax=Arcticibacter sp. MXS-1 TaxID=3341726 RepID=UPI0035A8DE5C